MDPVGMDSLTASLVTMGVLMVEFRFLEDVTVRKDTAGRAALGVNITYILFGLSSFIRLFLNFVR